MVPTNLYNYFVVLKYLLGAKRAGANLKVGGVCQSFLTEHPYTPDAQVLRLIWLEI